MGGWTIGPTLAGTIRLSEVIPRGFVVCCRRRTPRGPFNPQSLPVMNSNSPFNAKAPTSTIHPLRFETPGSLLLAGKRRHFDAETREEIPQLWHDVGPQMGSLPTVAEQVGYGACFAEGKEEEGFDYLAAAPVKEVRDLPDGWTTVKLPAQRYAVFAHEGPVSQLNETVERVMAEWLPQSGQGQPVKQSPAGEYLQFLEHYGKDYDPETGTGDIELWVPVREAR